MATSRSGLILTTISLAALALAAAAWAQPATPATPPAPTAPAPAETKPADTKPAETKPADPSAPAKPLRPRSNLPAAADIQAKFIEATGGRANYEKVKYRVTKAKINMPGANIKGTVEVLQGPDRQFSQKSEFEGLGWIQQGSPDGKNVWETGAMGPRLMAPRERADVLRAADTHLELNLKEEYPFMDCIAVEKVDDRDAYKVALVAPDGSTVNRFYDKESGLLVRELRTLQTASGDIPGEFIFSDYREAGGLKTPFVTMQRPTTEALKMLEMTITVDSVEFPDTIPAETFAVPEDVKQLIIKLQTAAAEDADKAPPKPAAPTAPAPKK